MEVQNYNHGFRERGIYYNHSTYCDLIISGLIGIQPESGDELTISPLAPDYWDWFCLDHVKYHGHTLSVVWDRDGSKYGLKPGFSVFVDGKRVGHQANLGSITLHLSQ